MFAAVRDSQRQPKLSAPRFNFAEEDVHHSSIELKRVPRFLGGFFFAGDEVGVGDLFAAEVGLFEVALNPLRGSVGAPGLN